MEYVLNQWDDKTYKHCFRVQANELIRGLPLEARQLRQSLGTNFSAEGILLELCTWDERLRPAVVQDLIDIAYNTLLRSEDENKHVTIFGLMKERPLQPFIKTELASRALGEQCNVFTRDIVSYRINECAFGRIDDLLSGKNSFSYSHLGLSSFSAPPLEPVTDFIDFLVENFRLVTDEQLDAFHKLLIFATPEDTALHVPYWIMRKLREEGISGMVLPYSRSIPIAAAGVPWRAGLDSRDSQVRED